MTDPAAASSGALLWTYKRPFSIGVQHECWVLVESRLKGLTSRLIVDGEEVASERTGYARPEDLRNHHFAADLPGGRRLEVEVGWVNALTIGIAVRLDGALVHESHKGRTLAFPPAIARMVAKAEQGGARAARPAVDLARFRRNKVPILVDIATGLLFFLVAKLTDLKTAALVGAAVGLGLVVVQRFVTVDLIGGMMLFGVVMLLLSAGFAILFEDEEVIKHRSTVVGLVAAACFLVDGLVLKGRRLGAAVERYMAHTDIDPARLSIGMGLTGLVMAGGNSLVAWGFSTDAWLFYTTFLDLPVSMALVIWTMHWARSGGDRPEPAPR